jgi:FecR protein
MMSLIDDMESVMRTLRPTIMDVSKMGAAALSCLLVAALACAAGSSDVPSDSNRIAVTALAGKVSVTMAGVASHVHVDSTVRLPARIVTADDGMLGLAQAKTEITVAADTDIEIPADAAEGELIARLIQHRGNVFYDVAHRDVGRLRVETPFLVAVVKGTQFNVAAQADRTTISLFEGQLEIRTPDDSDVIQLNAGEIAIRSLTDDSIRVVRMDQARLPAPDAGRPSDAPQAARGIRTPLASNGLRLDVGGDAAPSTSTGVMLDGASDTLGFATDLDLPSGEIGTGAALDLGLGNTAVGADASLGSTSVDLGAKTGVDLGAAGSVDANLTTTVDLGAGTIDAGLATTVDLGAGSVAAGLTAGAGGGAIDLGLNTGITLGGGALDLGLNTGVAAGSTTPALNTNNDPAAPVDTTAPAPPPAGGGLLGGLLGGP